MLWFASNSQFRITANLIQSTDTRSAVQLQNTPPLKMIMLTAYKPTLREIQLQNTPPQKMIMPTTYKPTLSEIQLQNTRLKKWTR